VNPKDTIDPQPEDGPRVGAFTHDGADYVVFSLPAEPAVALPLSAREREVLAALLAGHTNARIAADLGTSARTVANQVASIFRKLGVSSRAALAVRVGVVGSEGESAK
jgi:DNA-binding NarL/FixJ family response regulator